MEKLIGAVVDGDLDLVKKCLLGGTSPTVVDGDGRTPLHHAVEHNRKDCVRVLMAQRLGTKDGYSRNNFNIVCKRPTKKWTPVHEAAHSGHVDMIHVAQSYKAKMDTKDVKGLTPVMLAIIG